MTNAAEKLLTERRALQSELDALGDICEECGGMGEIPDRSKINPTVIDEPYKRCPECGGGGIIN